MPAVGCHAKQKQRMMEIKDTVRIRGGEGERGEPHVCEEEMAVKLSAGQIPAFQRKQPVFSLPETEDTYSFSSQ